MTSDKYKTIICLANSKKFNGRCVAGKDQNNGLEWIRPISNSSAGELSESQIRYNDNSLTQVLDIIKIPFIKVSPKYYQPENVLIGRGSWEKIGNYPINKLDLLCDHPQTIWDNDQPDTKKIATSFLKQNKLLSSLLLIKPESACIRVSHNGYEIKLRVLFKYNKIDYDFPLTDLEIIKTYGAKSQGIYNLTAQNLYFCISLAEPLTPSNGTEEYCYKLVASIILA